MMRYPRLPVVILTLAFAATAARSGAADPTAQPRPAEPPATTGATDPGAAPQGSPAPQGAQPPQGAPAPAGTPAVRNIGGPGDYGLRERLTKRLARDPDLGRSKLGVALVNGGVVYSGTVPHWAARRRALSMAGAERGVINVTDQMEITRGDVKDGAIVKAMAGILEDQREPLGLKDLDIAVSDGVATLSGTVKNFAARVRAEESAGAVLGATRIVNRLRPQNAPSGTDDVTIRRALATYLKDSREYPYAGEIQVKVVEGRVRLEGRVPLYLARQQAGTMAVLVGGVREVENRIVVDPSLQARIVGVTEVP